jgi:hypothetical protein
MKLRRLALQGLPMLIVLSWSIPQALACTATGFVRDSINLTAALINPKTTVSGDVDATGCNIGIYYTNTGGPGGTARNVNGASIHSANYFGVVNNGGDVNVENSTIYDIGEVPLNGDQHGVAIYWASGSNATGTIQNNVIWNYQKGGISVIGPLAQATIQKNTVIGQGPVDFIAQNGIELGFGATATVSNNLVAGNSYTGTAGASSGGILLFGGDCYGGAIQKGTTVQLNILVGNDVGVWFSNLDASCNPPTTPTKDQAISNTIRNNGVNNTSGDGPGAGYQAGVSDSGDGDTIKGNSICGVGYTPVTPPPFLFHIDVTFTNNATVKNNTTCSTSGPVTDSAVETQSASKPVRASVVQ